MTALYDILSSSWAQALGWTLIHSLWQSLMIFLIVFCLHRFVRNKYAQVRYVLALCGLAVICMLSIATFLHLKSSLHHDSLMHTFDYQLNVPENNNNTVLANSENVDFTALIQSHMPLLITIWLFGTIIFSLRMAGGWWYVSKLRRESLAIGEPWINKLNTLSYKFGIRHWIELASSDTISSPVVFGYFKPIILIPASMLTGLTTEQVETIFLHELAHIKRNDYLINLIQSFVESIFFFNPFVWIISSWVRTEREHCCDDAVIAFHGNPLDYANALTRLEEVRVGNTGIALALSGNRRHLLGRIKRIMERSVKKYPARERIIPLILFVAGLTCASWLSIRPSDKPVGIQQGYPEIALTSFKNTVPADTVPAEQKDSAVHYSFEENIVIDADEKQEEEIAEEYNFDTIDFFSFEYSLDLMDPMTSMELAIDPFRMKLMIPHEFHLDSVPGFSDNWQDEYHREFEKAFKENFPEFYDANAEEVDRMMQDLDGKFQDNFDHKMWREDFDRHILEMQRARQEHLDIFRKHQNMQHEKMKMFHDQHLLPEKEKTVRSNSMKSKHDHMKMWREKRHHLETEQQASTESMKDVEKDMNRFNAELKEELVKDGYLRKDEDLHSMTWNISEKGASIKINGKEIQDIHKKKYIGLHKKYFLKKDKSSKK